MSIGGKAEAVPPEMAGDFDGMRRPLATCLIVADQRLREEIKLQADNLPLKIVLEMDSLAEPGRFQDSKLDLLIIDAHAADPLEDVVARVKSTAPELLVAVVDTERNSELILRAIRAGADEVVVAPLGAGLRSAMRQLQQKHGRNRAARVLGLVSAKGGCGGTTIACHLAAALASMTKENVLLADLDLDGGLAAFLLKAQTSHSIVDAAKNIHRLDVSYWKGLIASARPNLDVIPAPEGGAAAAVEQLGDVLRAVRSMYGWVVVDLGSGPEAPATALLESVDELLITITPDVTAFYQGKQMVHRLLQRRFPLARVGAILNRANRDRDLDGQQVRNLVGIELQAAVPEFAGLADCYTEGNLAAADSLLGKSIAELAARKAGVALGSGKRRRSLLDLVWAS